MRGTGYFLKIGKLNFQQEKSICPYRKNKFRQNTKNRQSAKINSRKKFVPQGVFLGRRIHSTPLSPPWSFDLVKDRGLLARDWYPVFPRLPSRILLRMGGKKRLQLQRGIKVHGWFEQRWGFARKTLQHLTVFSPETGDSKRLAKLTANTKNYWQITRKGYRPSARGYVIYSPRAFPRGQRTRGINHITQSWRPINGLFLHWRGFLKACKNTLKKNVSIVHFSFVF